MLWGLWHWKGTTRRKKKTGKNIQAPFSKRRKTFSVQGIVALPRCRIAENGKIISYITRTWILVLVGWGETCGRKKSATMKKASRFSGNLWGKLCYLHFPGETLKERLKARIKIVSLENPQRLEISETVASVNSNSSFAYCNWKLRISFAGEMW